MGRQKKRAGLMSRGRTKTSRAAEHAWDKAHPMSSAKDRIGPAVGEARDKMGPAVEHARVVIVEDVVPRVSTAMSSAVTASKPYRTEAKRRGSAAYAALKGEVEVSGKRNRRWPRMLVLVAALGGAAVAAYRLLKRGSSQQWQPMHATPGPAPSGHMSAHGSAGHADRPGTADPAGAGPGEALADQATSPSGRTTPDRPAEHTETPGSGGMSDEGGPVPSQPTGRDRPTGDDSRKRPSRSGPTSRNTGPRGRPRSS